MPCSVKWEGIYEIFSGTFEPRNCSRSEADVGARVATKPVDPAAYEAYLKGRFFIQKKSRASHARAVAYFEEAVQIDPEYAPAWAGLSVGYT